MKETFGQRFTRLRKEKEFTQDDIALKVNISPQAVSKWENDISMPDISILTELADILEISVDELLGRSSQKTVKLLEEKDINKMVLKIKVLSTKGHKINMNLPIPLIKVCIETGIKLPQINNSQSLKDIDLSEIYKLVEQGVVGELLSVESSEGDRILIVVE